MLDLHRLMLLREVKRRGSMSAAARELSYSHSAVSQQLALLEKEAGVALLERVGRGIKLTLAGEGLVRNTEPILAAIEHAESDLARAHLHPHGVVTLAAFATISRGIMPAALVSMARDFPALDVHLRLVDPEEAVLQLLSRRVDAVITDDYPGTQAAVDGIHATVLGNDRVRAYLPDPSMDGNMERIRQVPWVTEGPSAGSTQWVLRVCRERGFEPVVAHESTDLLFHLRMVQHGLAAAFLPDMVLHETGCNLQPSTWLSVDQHRRILFLTRAGSEHNPSIVAVRKAIEGAMPAGSSCKSA